MDERGNLKDFEFLLGSARETIEGIIRATLRVSLSRSDGRRDNEDALDIKQAVELQLWEKYIRSRDESGGEAIRDFQNYAAVATYHVCYDHLRRKNPEWCSLKNRLRYFLENREGFAVWESECRELVCGFVSWQYRKKHAVGLETLEALENLKPGKHLKRMNSEDWAELHEAIFKQTAIPVRLDDLVHFIAELFGVRDRQETTDSSAGEERTKTPVYDLLRQNLSPEEGQAIKEFLERLWAEIRRLRPNQRKAYLLNFADGDIQVFPWNGIACVSEIGAALEISDEQFERLWQEMSSADRPPLAAAYDERFAFLWLFLPLKDSTIASMLGGTVSQVAGLRRLAREALAKRMREFGMKKD
ncbi:MAG: hypothetical protein L0229_11675 [Blastocatellia bacterium]|nr:hypothetical protein [Blastocatellia bacterium]